MPLAMMDVDNEYTVKKINGRESIQKHLESMGIVPGAVVKVVAKGASGVIVNVKESRVALGYELANKILV